MDLKDLLNQTTIKSNTNELDDTIINTNDNTTNDNTTNDNTTNDNTTNSNTINDNTTNDNTTNDNTINSNNGTYTALEPEPSDDEGVPLDLRFCVPWNKLEKGSKMNRILLFITSETTNKQLNENQTKALKNLLFHACEAGLFNKISEVKYNESFGEIESFKNLEFNESTKKYKLKTNGTKNRSVSKSRSNIDRLMKKK